MTASATASPAATGRLGASSILERLGVSVRQESRLRDVPAYVWVFFGTLVAMLFSGKWAQLHIPIGLDRIGYPLGLVLLFLDQRRSRVQWRPVHWWMLALVAWTVGSAVFAGTATSQLGLFSLLDRIVVPFTYFVIAPILLATTYRRDLFLKLMALLGLYLGITAVFEVVGPHALVFPRYIMDPNVGILFGRARGPFVGAEPDGMMMAMILVMAAVLYGRARGVWRLIALLSAAVCFLGVILCQTRSIWLAAIAGLILISLITPALRRLLPFTMLAVALAIGVFLVAVPELRDMLTERLTADRSIYDRLNVNDAALRVIQAKPLFGLGWAEFLQYGVDWVRQAPDYPVTNVTIEVHNVFLGRAAETGILGAVLWAVCALLGPVSGVWRRPVDPELQSWRQILIMAVCVWLVVSFTSPNPYAMTASLFWLIGGLVSTPSVFGVSSQQGSRDSARTGTLGRAFTGIRRR